MHGYFASVILPIGAIDNYLPTQLESLKRQTYNQPFEIVLSLNCDIQVNKPLLERLCSDAEIHATIVDSSQSRGAAFARNIGARASSGRALVFCDADDLADPDWLREILLGLETAEAVGGYLEEALLTDPRTLSYRPPATPGENPTFMGFPYLVSANMAISRDAFDAVGGFPEGYTRCEDIAFSWALLRAGHTLGFRKEAVMHYRYRSGLSTMLKQHFYYGIGMSEVLARDGLPTGEQAGAKLLKGNNQSPRVRSLMNTLRRGSIASGRVAGLIKERRK